MKVHSILVLARLFIGATSTSPDFLGGDIPCAEVNTLLGVLPDNWKECYYQHIGTEDVLSDCDTLEQKDFCGAAQECFELMGGWDEYENEKRSAGMHRCPIPPVNDLSADHASIELCNSNSI